MFRLVRYCLSGNCKRSFLPGSSCYLCHIYVGLQTCSVCALQIEWWWWWCYASCLSVCLSVILSVCLHVNTDRLNCVSICIPVFFAAVYSLHCQQQQQVGKPRESPMTSPHQDKENIVTSSQSSSSSRSIFSCVELMAETSCSRPSTLAPPYLLTHQSLSSHYRHVTSSPTAMFVPVTSPPVVSPTPVSTI